MFKLVGLGGWGILCDWGDWDSKGGGIGLGEKLRVSKKVVKKIQNWWSGWSKVVNVTWKRVL